MNASTDQINSIISLFSESVQKVLIFVPAHADVDACAAAMGWAEVLREQEKEVEVVSPRGLRVSSDDLPGVEELSHELGAENLIIALPHDERRVSQVTSHVGEQSGKIYITIRPATGVRPLDAEDVEISHGGVSADVLVLVGVNDIAELEPFASEYFELFSQVPSLVMVKNGAPEFGSIRLAGEYGSTVSEESTQLFLQLGWEVNAVAATALLRGVELATEYLSSPLATAETFEAVAALLRAGAKRLRHTTPVSLKSGQDQQPIPTRRPVMIDDQTKSLAEILAQRQKELAMALSQNNSALPDKIGAANTGNASSKQPNSVQSNAPQPPIAQSNSAQSKRRRRRRKHQTEVKGYAGRKASSPQS